MQERPFFVKKTNKTGIAYLVYYMLMYCETVLRDVY